LYFSLDTSAILILIRLTSVNKGFWGFGVKTVFDKILDTTTGPKSFDWYKKQVKSMTTPGARGLINQGKATLKPKYGVMNLFAYDPKHMIPHLMSYV
jgi:hypothetical protein